MPDRFISVYGSVVVGEVTSIDAARPNTRAATCEVTLPGSEDSALIDIYFWSAERPEATAAVASVVGELFCPADAEPVIFAETFTVLGPHANLGDQVLGPLGVLAVGVVRAVSGRDTTIETEVYHRQHRARTAFDVIARRPENSARFSHTPTPTVGSILLARGILSHFAPSGLAVILIDALSFFSFQPSPPRTTVQTQASGRGKRKFELSGSAASVSSSKKAKPNPSPFGSGANSASSTSSVAQAL